MLSVHTARGKFIATMTCYSTTYPFSPIIAREVSFEGAIEALDAAICEDWSKELQNEGNV